MNKMLERAKAFNELNKLTDFCAECTITDTMTQEEREKFCIRKCEVGLSYRKLGNILNNTLRERVIVDSDNDDDYVEELEPKRSYNLNGFKWNSESDKLLIELYKNRQGEVFLKNIASELSKAFDYTITYNSVKGRLTFLKKKGFIL